MKKTKKLWSFASAKLQAMRSIAIIAMVAVIGFGFVGCADDGGDPPPPPNSDIIPAELQGTWKWVRPSPNSGHTITRTVTADKVTAEEKGDPDTSKPDKTSIYTITKVRKGDVQQVAGENWTQYFFTVEGVTGEVMWGLSSDKQKLADSNGDAVDDFPRVYVKQISGGDGGDDGDNEGSTDGLIFTLINNGTAYEVSGDSNNTVADIKIPKTYNGLPVITIGNFSPCGEVLKSVVIPNSITSIKSQAFLDCWRLTEIKIPESVVTIASGAFNGCTNLTEITMPAVTEYFYDLFDFMGKKAPTSLNTITFIGDKGIPSNFFDNYYYNPYISKIIISDSVPSISYNAFSNCKRLTEITIGNSVISIGGSAFTGCTSLTSITIPNSVTSIGDWVFSGCTSLASITVPIVGTAFYNLFGTNNSVIPTSLKTISIYGNESIPDEFFRDCTNLTSIIIDDNVPAIGYSAFENCTSLETVKIGNSITSIGNYAFSGCTSLTEITIPASVISLGSYVFRTSGTSSLTSITFERWESSLTGNNRITTIGSWPFGGSFTPGGDTVGNEPNSSLKIFVPAGSLDVYKEAVPTSWQSKIEEAQ